MIRPASLALAATLGLVAAVACSDIVSPTRTGLSYDWRLLLNYDSAGIPLQDTLSFHWPRSSLPVKVWVEDQNGLPDHIRTAIATWKAAFLYGEWDAKVVSDSAIADVIVRAIQPPPQSSSLRYALAEACIGATDVDTVANRHQLRVPVHAYVYVSIPGDPRLEECLNTVATHELGHTMGLLQHSRDSTDIMYAVPTADALTASDVATVVNAYHFKATMVPVRP
ncbi:MAG TPA: matrixin family metalloprotease [Gemmatimonadales bacterium]|nr:matrixin family metalloprotease [Gemmatimonadales bacterium]